jgi:hypothetical protein
VSAPLDLEEVAMPRKDGSLSDKRQLQRLPQRPEVWQVDARQVGATALANAQAARPWLIVVVSSTEEQILAFDLSRQAPTGEQVWHTLARAMAEPADGTPRRPAHVQVPPAAWTAGLLPAVEGVGVEWTQVGPLEGVDGFFEELAEQLQGQRQPGLLDMPGVSPDAVGRFFEAAALYYRQAPWRKVGERTVKVECPRLESGPWYAILMGQGGVAAGLVLYDSLATLDRLQQGDLSDEESARLTSALAVVFGEEAELAEADSEAARRYGWQVAGPDAYPSVYRKEPGLSTRPPLAWELGLLEGCLRAAPEFVKARKPRGVTPLRVTVPVATGELPLTLSWVRD